MHTGIGGTDEVTPSIRYGVTPVCPKDYGALSQLGFSALYTHSRSKTRTLGLIPFAG